MLSILIQRLLFLFSEMNRLRKKIALTLVFLPISLTFAQTDTWWWYGNSPIEVLDSVVGEANKEMQFQETALDGVTNTQWAYQEEYQIANTLDWLRMNIAPYLQWLVYIGMAIAVILLIYNGFLMVTHAIHNEWDFTKVKKKVTYIAIGIVLLTSFYAIIKLIVGIINSIFGTNTSGDTGF